jgi:ABC-type uncharacterized transport system substrate-binding protein
VIPKITIKYNDVLICYNLNDSINSYQWYEGSVAIQNATQQFYQTRKQPGNYSIVTIDKSGCTNSSNQISVAEVQTLTVFPNPASLSFGVQFTNRSEVKESEVKAIIRIVNSVGIKVMEFHVENLNDKRLAEIPVTNLREGIYFIHVLLGNGNHYTTKIVVAK